MNSLVRALAPFHPRLRDFPATLPFAWDEVPLRNGAVFTLSTDVGAIDLLTEVSGVGNIDEVKANSILIQAFERSVWTLDLPGLIRAKRTAGRYKLRAVKFWREVSEAIQKALEKLQQQRASRPGLAPFTRF